MICISTFHEASCSNHEASRSDRLWVKIRDFHSRVPGSSPGRSTGVLIDVGIGLSGVKPFPSTTCRVSSLGEHSLVTRGVEGSIPLHGARSRPLLVPVEPDETWPNGKARGLGPRERRFDSSRLDCVRSTKAVRSVVIRDLAGSSPVVHPAQLHTSPGGAAG